MDLICEFLFEPYTAGLVPWRSHVPPQTAYINLVQPRPGSSPFRFEWFSHRGPDKMWFSGNDSPTDKLRQGFG